MAKRNTTARRITALVLTLFMVLTFAMPVMADNINGKAPFTITIVPSENTERPGGGNGLGKRFSAYAIFVGDIVPTEGDDGYQDGADTAPNNPPMQNQLVNVVWGEGVKGIKTLLGDLMDSDVKLSALDITDFVDLNKTYGTGNTFENKAFAAVNGDTTLGELFTRGLQTAGYVNRYGTLKTDGTLKESNLDIKNTAAVIARVINDVNGGKDNNNVKLARAFAKIVYEHLADKPTAVSKWDKENEVWFIGDGEDTLEKAGYYLIVDSGDSYGGSDFMIGVFGNQTIKVKSVAATVDKDIVVTDESGDETLVKGVSTGITEKVTFRLTGTLPENYANYNDFDYIFHDTLSDGFTLNENSIAVYAEDPDGKIYLIEGSYTIDNSCDDDCTFAVVFDNLKTVTYANLFVTDKIGGTKGNAAADTVEITREWKIVVQYTATVNENAVVVDPKVNGEGYDMNEDGEDDRNNNTVKLQYSNDVDKEEETDLTKKTATTGASTVYVYTYGLDLDKQDGAAQTSLAGAGFALTREVDDETDPGSSKTQYAVFTKLGDEYVIAGWVDEDAAETASAAEIAGNADWIWTDEVTELDTAEFPAENGPYYLAAETADTNIKIKGLDEGEYTLIERHTPKGYDTMADISFTVTAAINDDTTDEIPDGALTKLEAEIKGFRTDASISYPDEPNDVPGYVPFVLINMPVGFLPGTGGMGTTLFYIGGGVLLAVAVVLLIVMNKKEKNEKA